MYEECSSASFTVQRERTLKQNTHITCFNVLQELKTTNAADYVIIRIVKKMTEYFVFQSRVVSTAPYNLMVNRQELIGTTPYLTL